METDPQAPGTTGPPADPAALVDRLIAGGDWPEPELFEQMIGAGEAILGPLLDFLRTYPDPKDHDREIALYHGIGILGAIRSPEAIPVLVEILRRYPEESGEEAARVLGEFGEPGFEPALELVRDPEMVGYARQNAITAARDAAGTDPVLKARLAEVLRPMLVDAMERTRELDRRNAVTSKGEEPVVDEDEDLEEPDDKEAIEEEIPAESAEAAADLEETGPRPSAWENEPYEEVVFLIGDLAALADPEARGLIRSAFAENLVDAFWIDEATVEKQYSQGGVIPDPPLDWLDDYRERYRRAKEPTELPMAGVDFSPRPGRPTYVEELPPEPVVEPIRNTGPKLGRNDPCWCGSGKKYKKCHLGKDNRS